MKDQNDNNNSTTGDRIKMFTVGDSFDSADYVNRSLPPPPPAPTRRHPTPATTKAPRYKLVNHIYHEYCNYTTIHGVQYLGQKRPFREKIVWIVALVISIIICTHLIYNTYIKWVETPVIVSFSEKSTPVWNIPFPAVTICSETKSIRNESFDFTQFFRHLESFKGKVYEKPSNMSQIDLDRMRSLLQICGNHLLSGINFPHYEETKFDERLNEIIPKFNKTFPFCKWTSHYGDCMEVFFKTYTEEGICYTFNGLNASEMYREDTYQHQQFLQNEKSMHKRKYPTEWSLQGGYDDNTGIHTFPARVLGAGFRAGLMVSLQSFEKDFDYICRGALDGFKVSLHSPDDVPQVSKNYIRVSYDKEVVVLVKPNMITTMNAISDYEPNRRQCFFNTERYLRFFKIYTQNNCELECLSNYTLSKCGCVKFSMPRNPNTPVCDEKKIHCYDLAEDDFLVHEFAEGLADSDSEIIDSDNSKCNCLPSCTSLVYNTELSQGDFNIEKMLASHGNTYYLTENAGVRMSKLSIHFKENQFITSKRSELYGITDFVANCGGLLGLFMGFSALSIVEFFYHFTVRLMTNIQDARRV